MIRAGYAHIGDYDEYTNTSRRVRAATRVQFLARLRWLRKRKVPKEHVLQVGYEADTDEKWLAFYPEAEELDLTDWREELAGHADWDVWHDHDVSAAGEAERRIRVLGASLDGQQD